MTSIRKFLERLFSPASSPETEYWLEVRCTHCGEMLRGRVDMRNELSLADEEASSSAVFYCRKVLIGQQRCFQPVEVELFFDSNRKLVERKIEGGQFTDL